MLKNIVKAWLVVVMLALAIPASSEAAKAPKLSSTKVTLTVGKSKIITVKNTTKKVKWKNSAKGVVKVKKVSPRKVKITAKKKGKAKVTATVGGKKLTCKVTVKAKSTSATTTTASSKGTGGSTDGSGTDSSGDESTGNKYVDAGRYTAGDIDVTVYEDALVWKTYKTQYVNDPGAHCFLMNDGNVAFCMTTAGCTASYVVWIEPNGQSVTLDTENLVYIKGYDGEWYPNENNGKEDNGCYLSAADGTFADSDIYHHSAPLYDGINVTLKKLEKDKYGSAIDEDTDAGLVRECFGFYMPFKKDDGSYIQVQEVSYEITNNSRSDGKPVIECSFVNRRTKTGDDLKKYGDTAQAYPSVDIYSLHPGTCDLTVSVAGESITIHVTVEETVNNSRLNYADVLLAMMETPLGETAEVTLEGEFEPTTTVTIDGVDTVYENSATITVDGVKGANDVETLLNLGAWIVDNKSYRSGDEDDVDDDIPVFTYNFFREWAVGSDCGGLNTITEDAACLLGYTGYQTNDRGHLYTVAILNGQVWTFDAGGSGSAGVKGFSGGSTTNNGNGDYTGPSVGYTYNGTYPDRKWTIYYDILESDDTFTSVATETVTALSDLTRPLPWYGD